MKQYILPIIILIACCASAMALSITDRQVQDVLKRLDSELVKRNVYTDARQARIDSLKQLYLNNADNGSAWLMSTMCLADEYTAFNTDSALFYYTKGYDNAVATGADSIALAFRMQRATYLPLVGFMQDAVNEYESIPLDLVPRGMLDLYYDAGRQMYSYISSFYANYPQVSEWWREKSKKAQLGLIALLDKQSPKYKLNQGEYYFANKEYSKAKATLIDLLNSLPEESNMYARAANIVADIAYARGDENEYLYYMTLSAIADFKSATLEVMSLQELGEYLFKRGDVDRAYTYLSVALANAVKCHALMRMVQSSESLPLIQTAHKAEIDAWQNRIYLFIGGLALMLLVLIGLLLFLRREMKRLTVLKQHLQAANNIKEVYISQFLSLCSIYMDKLNQLCQLVNRKISIGKVDDLYKITKSGKFIEEQSKEFYEVFDNAFLHIYPSFVERVNELLRPEERIVLPDDDKLNTDLRILAFMRLGIEDCSRIAQVLNYSVNTIYAYRNKMKNRAINRDTFESDVMKISSID